MTWRQLLEILAFVVAICGAGVWSVNRLCRRLEDDEHEPIERKR